MNLDALLKWLDDWFPELADEIRASNPDAARIRLNSITGLEIQPSDDVEYGSMMHLLKLKEMYGDSDGQ